MRSISPQQKLIDDQDAVLSYSQFGEDQIILQILQSSGRLLQGGFFVDVGAHHPRRYSNTFLLYEYYGWRGVNVEPNPDMSKLYAQHRPEDVIVNCAISETEGTATYFQFSHPGLNTLDPQLAARQQARPPFKLLGTTEVKTRPLRDILAETAEGREIDLMNIDVEGFEYQVITSNDWSRFRPRVICLEDHSMRLDNVGGSRSYAFMREQGYRLRDFAVVSALYVRVD